MNSILSTILGFSGSAVQTVSGFLLGPLGKYLWMGAGLILVGLVAYVGALTIQVKDQENTILRQQQTITSQQTTIDAYKFIEQADLKAAQTLTDRLAAREKESQDLTSQVETILTQGSENDGPVAPVLDSVVRDPADRRQP